MKRQYPQETDALFLPIVQLPKVSLGYDTVLLFSRESAHV